MPPPAQRLLLFHEPHPPYIIYGAELLKKEVFSGKSLIKFRKSQNSGRFLCIREIILENQDKIPCFAVYIE